MKTLYIVTGATGQYSDYQEWFVRGFFDLEKAKALRDLLEAKARELGIYENEYRCCYGERIELEKQMLPLDEHVHCDYTGLTYLIHECEVEE